MKSRLKDNIKAFLLAFAFVVFTYPFILNTIVTYNSNSKKIKSVFKQNLTSSKVYIPKGSNFLKDLEAGKIILFGSSELGNRTHKYIPYNYFNKDLKLPLIANGHAGHQIFAILSQLAAYNSKKVRNNAKVVIFLSPGWFQGNYANGTNISNFLEYMNSAMLYRLYFTSDVDDKFKILIGQYIKKNLSKIKNPTFIYKYASKYPHNNLIYTYTIKQILLKLKIFKSDNIKAFEYRKPNLDYNKLRKEALQFAKPATNNPYGINNDYYTKYVKNYLANGTYPKVPTVPSTEKNQEYKDFLNLLELLKKYKHKPLFIMQEQNPYVYDKSTKVMQPILDAIQSKLKEYGYDYLNLYTLDKKSFKKGILTDIMHTGELGWVEIDKKIIEHFMKNEK